jgi:hypothetical protein
VSVDDLAKKIMDGIAPEYKKKFKPLNWRSWDREYSSHF